VRRAKESLARGSWGTQLHRVGKRFPPGAEKKGRSSEMQNDGGRFTTKEKWSRSMLRAISRKAEKWRDGVKEGGVRRGACEREKEAQKGATEERRRRTRARQSATTSLAAPQKSAESPPCHRGEVPRKPGKLDCVQHSQATSPVARSPRPGKHARNTGKGD